MDTERPGIDVFDRDAMTNTGYLYTQTDRLSCKFATKRTTDIILETGALLGKSSLDLACGDAYYTIKFCDHGGPKQLVAADGALNAVRVARGNRGPRPISF